MNSDSKTKKVHAILSSNPHKTFNAAEICRAYQSEYVVYLRRSAATTILGRLFSNENILRTEGQLKGGFCYSKRNSNALHSLYDNHLLPYPFPNREELINHITQRNFEHLRSDCELDISLKDYNFAETISKEYLLNFIAINVGFLMCDGHIKRDFHEFRYFFNMKEDAEQFKMDFQRTIKKERISLNYRAYCYCVGTCDKNLAKLFNSLGVPTGNKVYAPFLIPNWIYHGPMEMKRNFLSTIYGNEGSKPQDSKWRIQFVLSKTKEFVPNLLQFLNQVRTMLHCFGIGTSHIQLRKQENRAFCGRFYIKGKEDVTAFYNKIGFLYASEKQEVLESLVLRGKS